MESYLDWAEFSKTVSYLEWGWVWSDLLNEVTGLHSVGYIGYSNALFRQDSVTSKNQLIKLKNNLYALKLGKPHIRYIAHINLLCVISCREMSDCFN